MLSLVVLLDTVLLLTSAVRPACPLPGVGISSRAPARPCLVWRSKYDGVAPCTSTKSGNFMIWSTFLGSTPFKHCRTGS